MSTNSTATTKRRKPADPLAALRAHPRVAEVWTENNVAHDEPSDVWAQLKPGFVFEHCHCVHEYTAAAALAAVESAEPCDCDECVEG